MMIDIRSHMPLPVDQLRLEALHLQRRVLRGLRVAGSRPADACAVSQAARSRH